MQGRNSISIKDRLRLMGIQDSNTESPANDIRATRAAKLQKAHNKDNGLGIQVHEDDTAGPGMDQKKREYEVPHISRESILRKMRAEDGGTDNPYDGSGYGDYDIANLDPDVPIPSREVSSDFDETPQADIRIKQEGDEDEVDVYSIPDLYSPERSLSRMDLHDYVEAGGASKVHGQDQKGGSSNSTTEDEGPLTPRADKFNISHAPAMQPYRSQQMPCQNSRPSAVSFSGHPLHFRTFRIQHLVVPAILTALAPSSIILPSSSQMSTNVPSFLSKLRRSKRLGRNSKLVHLLH